MPSYFRRSGRLLALLPAICLGLLFAGCEESVDPILESDIPFTMYGLLAPTLDTQWVRVFPIEPTLELRDDSPLDAVVTMTNLTTGEVRILRDSVIVTRNGLYEHAFWSDFNARYGHRYRVEVRRSDGAFTYAQVDVPVRTVVTELTDQMTTLPPVRVPIQFTGDLPQLLQLRLVYLIQHARDQFETVTLDYEADEQGVPEGRVLTLNLSDDYNRIQERLMSLDISVSCGFAIVSANFHYLVSSLEWDPPGGVFDPDIISMPGVMDNVEQGYGFIGAGYRDYKPLNIPPEVQQAAGFRLPREMTTCGAGG